MVNLGCIYILGAGKNHEIEDTGYKKYTHNNGYKPVLHRFIAQP
jgi:hypothetical protein